MRNTNLIPLIFQCPNFGYAIIMNPLILNRKFLLNKVNHLYYLLAGNADQNHINTKKPYGFLTGIH